ncbi:MAG TPA: AbrB/MazE/SpoVT family DNA-binding domain-containing protein [Nitratifractor sp.]|nr:AbrB/MazE/SpoVT family DNA-binding domain-containing protein [Nitratifractor sp.]HHH21019.1 AbrB/MazE/SpoVT family DNA-binding domain-containing protein [Nitratifractor sp.]
MTTTISKWGNSQGLRFPKKVMELLHLSVGDKMKVSVENGRVILEPAEHHRKKYSIDELVKKIPHDYKPYEAFNDKVGIEEW